jgi:hypothetical protein
LQAHAVLFAHDAPIRAAESINQMLHKDNIEDALTLPFIAPANKIDLLIRHTLGTSNLLSRAHVILQHLLIYRETNHHYKNLPVDREENFLLRQNWPRFQQVMEEAKRSVVSKASCVTDKESLDYEDSLGADIAGTSRQQHPGNDGESNPHEGDDTEIAFRHSCVTKKTFMAPLGKAQGKQVEALLADKRFGDKPCDSDSDSLSLADSDDGATLPMLRILDCDGDGDEVKGGNISERVPNPFGDTFGDVGDIICAAYPLIFITGTAYQRATGTLTPMQASHLLMQFYRGPARNRQLVMYLFDTKC